MENKKNKSLIELIKSNEIASTTSLAFFTLGCAAICTAGTIKTGIDILSVLQDKYSPSILIAVLGIQGVGAIAGGYVSAMRFAHLGKILENEQETIKFNKPKM
jgi:uncharacterized protein YcsI (UPF0317 family)